MIRKTSLLLIAAMVCLASGGLSAAADRPEVIAEVERNRIYEGESVTYRVTLHDVENPIAPKLGRSKDFDVTSLGEQNLNSSFITNINGQVTTVIRRGRSYSYRLTPLRAGTIRIPAPTVEVNGQELKGEEVTLRVVAPEDQDLVRMKITAQPSVVYPTQPFTVTLSVAVKALAAPNEDRSPVVAGRTGPPALQIPWVNDDELPDGLRPTTEWRAWLEPLENQRGIGFGINNFGRNSILSLFDAQAIAFCPRALRIQRPDGSGTLSDYWDYQFSRTFTPQKIGRYSFGPVSLKGVIATKMSGPYGLAGEPVYAVAKPLSVTVKDVPEQGRPESYLGAVGEFRWSAELAPKKARVGDPMTLALALRGTGSLDGAVAPDLAKMPVIAQHFKTYAPTQEIKGGACVFSYTLRPLEAGIKEFPAIPAAYFDVAAGKYVTVQSEPIPIEVSKADRLSPNQILAAPGAPAADMQEVQVRNEGLFANIADPAAAADQSVRPTKWLVGLGGLAGAYALVALVTIRFRRVRQDKSLVRRRQAAAKARQRVRGGLAALDARRVREGAEEIQAALVGLVADMADMPEAAATSKDVCRQLAAFGVDGELVDRVARSLQTCEAARYASASASVDGLRSEAGPLLENVIRILKKNKRLR